MDARRLRSGSARRSGPPEEELLPDTVKNSGGGEPLPCRKGGESCFSDPALGFNDVDRTYNRINAPNTFGNPERGGQKLGQTGFPAGMKIVNGGAYRYQWNVDGATNTMALFMTGLDENNKQFQKVKVVETKIGVPLLDFEGRWGFTAATGGAVMHTEVFNARIDVPLIEPL